MWRDNLVLIAATACFVTGGVSSGIGECIGECSGECSGECGSGGGGSDLFSSGSRDMEEGTEYINIENTDDAVKELDFLDGKQNIAVVVHGRQGSAFDQFSRKIRSALLKSDPNSVVILVEWALVSSLDYETAFNSVPFVADDIISLIDRLEKAGKIDRELVHLIGFDIGAHIVGIVFRDRRVGVPRVTGLSPAGQNWDTESRRLRKSDAEYVEAIHTDYTGARAFGIGDEVGTVDIYANTGTSQPGCTTNQCNHDRAWDLFAASLEMGGHLIAFGCGSLANMTANRCTGGPTVALGTNTLFKEGSGIYRVNTGRVYPYNL